MQSLVFLTRGDLWQSWEKGALVFEEHLIDADWSINNFNWQWLSTSFVELSSRAGSSNWRSRIVSRYSLSMVDLGNLPFDSSGNHNETWCMESYLVDSVRFNIHQRRERLAMELQKGNNNTTTTTDAPYYNYSSSEHKATKNPFLPLFHQYSNNEIPTFHMERRATTSTAHPSSD